MWRRNIFGTSSRHIRTNAILKHFAWSSICGYCLSVLFNSSEHRLNSNILKDSISGTFYEKWQGFGSVANIKIATYTNKEPFKLNTFDPSNAHFILLSNHFFCRSNHFITSRIFSMATVRNTQLKESIEFVCCFSRYIKLFVLRNLMCVWIENFFHHCCHGCYQIFCRVFFPDDKETKKKQVNFRAFSSNKWKSFA